MQLLDVDLLSALDGIVDLDAEVKTVHTTF